MGVSVAVSGVLATKVRRCILLTLFLMQANRSHIYLSRVCGAVFRIRQSLVSCATLTTTFHISL